MDFCGRHLGRLFDGVLGLPLTVYAGSAKVEKTVRSSPRSKLSAPFSVILLSRVRLTTELLRLLLANNSFLPNWRYNTINLLLHASNNGSHKAWKQLGSNHLQFVDHLEDLLRPHYISESNDNLRRNIGDSVDKNVLLASLMAQSKAFWATSLAPINTNSTMHDYSDHGNR